MKKTWYVSLILSTVPDCCVKCRWYIKLMTTSAGPPLRARNVCLNYNLYILNKLVRKVATGNDMNRSLHIHKEIFWHIALKSTLGIKRTSFWRQYTFQRENLVSCELIKYRCNFGGHLNNIIVSWLLSASGKHNNILSNLNRLNPLAATTRTTITTLIRDLLESCKLILSATNEREIFWRQRLNC